MKIVPFPGRDEGSGDARHAALEAALDGEGETAVVASWRELRADVRALAPAMTPEFERELSERLAAHGARGLREVSPVEIPPGPRKKRFRTLRPPSRLGIVAGLVGSVAIAAVVAAVIAGPARTGAGPIASAPAEKAAPSEKAATSEKAAPSSPGAGAHIGAIHAAPRATAPSAAAAPAGAAASAPAAGAQAGASGRVQQRAATLSFSASASEVQTVADRVAHLATSLGGFVQSSQVQVLAPQEGTSHAELDLRLPSAKLTRALDSLGRLAPVSSESESLQDITNAYDAARQRLGDATAERRALLRALALASTEGEIDSLRERLSRARRAITEDQSAFRAVAQQASTSEVEVTVLGNARAASEGLTLHRGLHEARKVLVATVAVTLIAVAILAPLALLLLALTAARHAWLRYRRERVLDAR